MNEVYKEKIPMYIFVTAVMSITCLILLVILVSQFTNRAVEIDTIGKVIVGFVLFLNTIVLVSFRELTISVTDRKIYFGFGKFKKHYYLDKLKKVEIGEYKFSNYFGYGIRFGRDNTVGYVPRGGAGVKLSFEGDKKDYFLISNRTEELKSILEKNIK